MEAAPTEPCGPGSKRHSDRPCVFAESGPIEVERDIVGVDAGEEDVLAWMYACTALHCTYAHTHTTIPTRPMRHGGEKNLQPVCAFL